MYTKITHCNARIVRMLFQVPQYKCLRFFYGFELIKTQINWIIIIILKNKWYECHSFMLSHVSSLIHYTYDIFLCLSTSFYLFITILNENHISFSFDSSISLKNDNMPHCKWSCNQATNVNLSDVCAKRHNQIGVEKRKKLCATFLLYNQVNYTAFVRVRESERERECVCVL